MDDNKVLGQLAKGAGILFVGTLFAYLFKFIFRIVISRYFGPESYGLFSLGDMLLNIGILIALLGLSSGVVKFISHYFSLGDLGRTKGTFFGSLKVSFMLSLIVTLFFVFFSRQISIGIFHRQDLVSIMVVFSLTIPIYTLLILFSSALLAFKKPQYHFWSFSLGRNLAILLLTILIVLLGGTVFYISIAYFISFFLGLVMAFFFLENRVFPFFKSKVVAIYNYKELMRFSMPLFLSGIFVAIMGWADTFFIGVMKSVSDVGIYNVAMPLAASLGMLLPAFGNIFYPIMNELYAKNEFSQMSASFSVISRWLFFLSLPIVFIVVFFSKQILGILFGSAYIVGSSVLVILIIADFISTVAGPCEYALMTFNKTKTIFYINVSATIVNLAMNFILIPHYGIIGAALATALSLVFRKIIFLLIVRKLMVLNPTFSYYFKYLLSAGISLFIIYSVFVYSGLPKSLFVIIAAGILFFVFYLFLLLIFKSFTIEDLTILLAIEKKIGIDLSFIKKLVRRFI